MLKRFVFALVSTLVCLDGAAAQFVSLGSVAGTDGAWLLEADPEAAICIASATYTRSNNRFGFMSDGKDWELLLANDSWKLPVGSTYEVFFLTEREGWKLELSVVSSQLMASSRGLTEEFIRDLSRTNSVRLYKSDRSLIGRFSMEGSSKAITAAAECAGQLASARRTNPRNPFETAKDNPFSGTEKRI